ncbi:MAG: serine hydrolase domain-containing protein [Steroidobacteraceae bacterium]
MDIPVQVDLVVDGRQVRISGECACAFEPVLQAFGANFRERGELGASVCVYREGRKIVDLWGGHTDPAREKVWEAGTMVSMASVVKGMLAFAVHMLADRGALSYDAPVARYWPEFAAEGKERITVRQAISHHAAIHLVDAAEPGDYFRWEQMVAAIARQRPQWPAGTRGVYHTVSSVFILGKLIQCASGEYPWDFFRREVTERLGVDYHIRLTEAERARYRPNYDTEHFVRDANIAPDILSRFFAGMGDYMRVLTPDEQRAMPYKLSGGTARGAARVFAFASMDGNLDGIRVLSPQTIDLMTEVQWHEKCAVWGTPMRTALGILVNDPEFFYIGPNPKAFGTAGAGGSFAMADRDNRLAVGYSVNRYWPALALGDRARTLIDAVYRSL